ncbi:hypothetical protein [Crateriforma conspicua]|uniref:Uncharacterized protein n=1 Tax=Crateriforma conspicua TaxID=2527996 RepID=A0A5C5Y8A5_9PLAN|nr:hypothetical protein [Crateriforma conspicua]TWT71209.1 hypothetical protein Pan14r_35190 [Crateriforma conspicua]
MVQDIQHNDDLRNDFRRLGVRRDECRQAVIREAAAHRASKIAEAIFSQAASEHFDLKETSNHLSGLATSTYRLLDPRRRVDFVQRAHVARILPCELADSEIAESQFQPLILPDDRTTPWLSADADRPGGHQGQTDQRFCNDPVVIVTPPTRSRRPRGGNRPAQWIGQWAWFTAGCVIALACILPVLRSIRSSDRPAEALTNDALPANASLPAAVMPLGTNGKVIPPTPNATDRVTLPTPDSTSLKTQPDPSVSGIIATDASSTGMTPGAPEIDAKSFDSLRSKTGNDSAKSSGPDADTPSPFDGESDPRQSELDARQQSLLKIRWNDLTADLASVLRTIAGSTRSFIDAPDQRCATAFAWAAEQTTSTDQMILWSQIGLDACETSLRHEAFDACDVMIDSVHTMNLSHQQRQQWDQMRQDVDQAKVVAERVDGFQQLFEQSPETQLLTARYRCLILRDWDSGLAMVPPTASGRFARSAQQQLRRDPHDVRELIRVAQLWLRTADDESGRERESIHLYVRDQLQRAAAVATNLQRLELDKILDSMPAVQSAN